MLSRVLSVSLFVRAALPHETQCTQESSVCGYVQAGAPPFAQSFALTGPLFEPPLPLQGRQILKCVDPGFVPCPNGVPFCRPPGASCCDSGYYYYPESQMCCPGGICPQGWKCCPRNCCQSFGLCGSDGFCSTFTLLTQTRTLTRTRTSTSKSTSQITTTSENVQASTRTSASSRGAYSTGLCNPDSSSRHELDKRRYPWENYCTKICHIATKQEMFVVTIKRVMGETDQLIDSMCRGMRARQKAGQIHPDLNDGEDILEYNGKSNRVTNVKCGGFCTDANKAVGRGSYECDEYPPAAFNQKVNVQTRLCIEGYQNSGTQAPILSKLVQYCPIKKGDKTLFRVEGGCGSARLKRDSVPQLGYESITPTLGALQRREEETTFHLSAANATLRDPYGDGSLTYVAINLGALDDGRYHLDVTLDGQIDNLTVLDIDGTSYATASSPTGNVRLDFDVATGGDYIPFGLFAFTEKPVNLSYTANVTLSTQTSTAASLAGNGILNVVSGLLVGVACIAIAVGTLP